MPNRRMREHRFNGVEQLTSASPPAGARWVFTTPEGNEIAGVVNSAGVLEPNPYLRTIGAAELGSLTWTKTAGDAVDITVDATGVTMIAETGSTATGVKLAGVTFTGPAIVQSTILLPTIDTATADMLAVCGCHNATSGTDDWISFGWCFDTLWRPCTWAHDHNGGTPIESDTTTAIDLGAYVATGGNFFGETITRSTSNLWANACMADTATGTVRSTPSAVLITTNIIIPANSWNPFFYVSAPGGALTAKLTSLTIASSDVAGFW